MAQLFDTGIFSVLGTSSALGAGFTLGWYEAGTATPIDTYSDPGLTTPNTTPLLPMPTDAFRKSGWTLTTINMF